MVYNSPRRHLIQGISLLEDIIERRRRENQQLNDDEYNALIKLVKSAPLAPHQAKLGVVTSTANSTSASSSTNNTNNNNKQEVSSTPTRNPPRVQFQEQQSSNPLISHVQGTAAAGDSMNAASQQQQQQQNYQQQGAAGGISITNQHDAFSRNASVTNPFASTTSPQTLAGAGGGGEGGSDSMAVPAEVAAAANAGGKISLAARLRKAMGLGSALAMSELLKASRDDISSLVDFAVNCSSLTSSSVKLVHLLVDNIKRFVPKGKAVTPMIYNGDFMVDPISHTMIAYNNKVQSKLLAVRNAELVFDAKEEVCYIPIAAEGELFGFLQVANVVAPPKQTNNNNSKTDNTTNNNNSGEPDTPTSSNTISGERQKIIFAAASIAALALRTSWQLEDLEWSHKKQSTLLKVANSITSDAFASETEVFGRIAAKAKDLSDSQFAYVFKIDHDEEDDSNIDVKMYHKGELHSFPDGFGSGSDDSGELSSSNDASTNNLGFSRQQGGGGGMSRRRGSYNGISNRNNYLSSLIGNTGSGIDDQMWNDESRLASLAAEQVARTTQVLQLQQGADDDFVEVDGGSAVGGGIHRAAGGGSSAARAGSPRAPADSTDPLAVSVSRSRVGSGGGGTKNSSNRSVRMDLPMTLVKTVSIRNVLALPIIDDESRVVGVVVLANKNPKKMGKMDVPQLFEQRDAEVMLQLCSLASIALANSEAANRLNAEKRRRDAILSVLTHLNECDIRNVEEICRFVMHGARKLLNADRSTLFLIDEEHDELYSSVADSVGKVIRFPVGKGIAGRVALTGQAEMIRDAYADDRFNKEVDKQTGYRTLSILTLPVITKGNVLAVAQLVNKLDNRGKPVPFSQEDQEILRTFTMFAGMTLSNSKLLEFTVRAGQEAVALTNWEAAERSGGGMGGGLARSQTMTQLAGGNNISPISPSEVAEIEDALEKVRELAKKHPEKYDPTTIDFDLFALRDEADDGATGRDYACAVVVMLFQAAKFDVIYKVDEETLICFVVQCRKMYRYVPYHNFFHAVDVTQTIYTFMFHGGGRQLISELEAFIMLATAMCHDLDHMGVNNSYHLKSDSPLGILSSVSGNNSVLEVHHCNIAIQILTNPESNIFSSLSKTDSSICFKEMMSCILITDMARHADSLKQFEEASLDFDKNNAEHRLIAMQMMMKAADISNVTKPFHISRQWATAVTEEFYLQGDKERAKGMQVLPMNDRQLGTELAKGQLGFINFVASKFFHSMHNNLFEKMSFAVDRLESNKAKWEKIMEEDKSEH